MCVSGKYHHPASLQHSVLILSMWVVLQVESKKFHISTKVSLGTIQVQFQKFQVPTKSRMNSPAETWILLDLICYTTPKLTFVGSPNFSTLTCDTALYVLLPAEERKVTWGSILRCQVPHINQLFKHSVGRFQTKFQRWHSGHFFSHVLRRSEKTDQEQFSRYLVRVAYLTWAGSATYKPSDEKLTWHRE